MGRTREKFTLNNSLILQSSKCKLQWLNMNQTHFETMLNATGDLQKWVWLKAKTMPSKVFLARIGFGCNAPVDSGHLLCLGNLLTIPDHSNLF